MKVISAFILLVALLAQYSGRYLIMLNYKINKNYVARNLCVNRDKPTSGCNGKCYLKKQLAKTAKEENTPVTKNTEKNEILFLAKAQNIIIHLSAKENNRQYISQQAFTLQHSYCTIFHPPQPV